MSTGHGPDKASGHNYILLEKRLDALYKNPADSKEYTVLERVKGETLVGRKYEPLFDYFYEVTRRECPGCLPFPTTGRSKKPTF